MAIYELPVNILTSPIITGFIDSDFLIENDLKMFSVDFCVG